MLTLHILKTDINDHWQMFCGDKMMSLAESGHKMAEIRPNRDFLVILSGFERQKHMKNVFVWS